MALSRRDAYAIAEALRSSTGQGVTVVYNEGHGVIDGRHKKNILLYNAPGSTCEFVSGTYTCKSCNMDFDSEAKKERHDVDYPMACSKHYDCFESWTTHVAEYNHTECPIPGCAKAGVDFGTDSRFMQHFRNKH